jgi:hypothetical protein
MDVIKGYCVYTNRYIQGTYKWYVRGRGNKDKHEASHGYAVCISLILGSTLQSYPWYIAVLVGNGEVLHAFEIQGLGNLQVPFSVEVSYCILYHNYYVS